MKRLFDNLKYLSSKLFLPVVRRLNSRISSRLLKKIEKKFQLKILFRTNIYQWRVEMAREEGVKIGDNCRLYTLEFSSEPYLVEIGDNVVIATGTQFITHDGGAWLFYDHDDHSNDINVFGKIKVGSNCFIGINCIILPGSVIGDNCVIGAGSVVRGKIEPDSVVMGNPAKTIMKCSLYKKLINCSNNAIRVSLFDTEKKNRLVREKFCAESANPVKDISP